MTRFIAMLVFAAVLLAAPESRALDCTLEPTLSEAATALLGQGEQPSPDALRRAVEDAGSDLPAVRALRVTEDDDARVTRFLDERRASADAPLVCGEAREGDTRLLIVGARGGRLTVDGRDRLRVDLAARFSQPYLVGRGAGGQLERFPVPGDRAFTVPAWLPRPVQIQLVAAGPDGPRPVAQRWIGAREDDPSGASLVAEQEDQTSMQRRVAALRSRHRVRSLRDNSLLAREANEHAARVCAARRVRHGAERLDPRRRLARRGLAARVVGETIARGRTLGDALSALLDSPSHRITLIDRRFTDVGYGVAEAHGHTCVVALFAAWPRYVGIR